MAGSIAKAYVQIMPSMDGVAPKVKHYFTGAGGDSGKSFGATMVSGLKSVIAAAGLGKMLTDAIMSGSDLQQLDGGVKKIFDEMDTSAIMADAANAYKDLNMSANQYLAAINDVGAAFSATMGDEKGYSVAKTGLQAISDYATGTGKNVDVLSQKFTMITRSTSSYQSIADQFSGILPATSAGFLEQAQAAGILSGEYKNLTDVPIDEYQQAVSEMLKKGTAELGLAGNTAAETATTIAGSFAAMKSVFSDVLANLTLGSDLGPSLNALAETVKTFLVGNLAPAVINIVSALPGAVATFLNGIIPGNMLSIVTTAISQLSAFISANLPTILSDGARMISELATGFVQGLPEVLDAAGQLVESVLNSFELAFPDFIAAAQTIADEIGGALSEKMPELSVIFENLETVVIAATAAFVAYKVAITISSLIENVTQKIDALKKASEGQTLAQTLLNAVMNANPFVLVATLAAGLVAAIITLWNTNEGFRNAVTNAWQSIKSTVSSVVNSLVNFFTSTVPNALNTLVSGVKEIPGKVKNAFTSIDWGGIGSNIISGIARGIANGVSAIINAAKSAAQSALRAAKNALGIKSPSRVMRDEVGKFIPAGIAVGIEDNQKTLSAAMKDLTASTGDSFDADQSMRRTAPVGTVPGTHYGDFSFTFHVHTAPGQDSEQIARALMQEMQFEYERRLAQI